MTDSSWKRFAEARTDMAANLVDKTDREDSGYRANVACLLERHSQSGATCDISDPVTRDIIANDIINLIFGDEPKYDDPIVPAASNAGTEIEGFKTYGIPESIEGLKVYGYHGWSAGAKDYPHVQSIIVVSRKSGLIYFPPFKVADGKIFNIHPRGTLPSVDMDDEYASEIELFRTAEIPFDPHTCFYFAEGRTTPECLTHEDAASRLKFYGEHRCQRGDRCLRLRQILGATAPVSIADGLIRMALGHYELAASVTGAPEYYARMLLVLDAKSMKSGSRWRAERIQEALASLLKDRKRDESVQLAMMVVDRSYHNPDAPDLKLEPPGLRGFMIPSAESLLPEMFKQCEAAS